MQGLTLTFYDLPSKPRSRSLTLNATVVSELLRRHERFYVCGHGNTSENIHLQIRPWICGDPTVNNGEAFPKLANSTLDRSGALAFGGELYQLFHPTPEPEDIQQG